MRTPLNTPSPAVLLYVSATKYAASVDARASSSGAQIVSVTRHVIKRILTVAFMGKDLQDDGCLPIGSPVVETTIFNPLAFDVVNYLIGCLGLADEVVLTPPGAQPAWLPSYLTHSSLFNRLEVLCKLFRASGFKALEEGGVSDTSPHKVISAIKGVPVFTDIPISFNYEMKTPTAILFRTATVFQTLIGGTLALIAPTSQAGKPPVLHGLAVQTLDMNARITGMESIVDGHRTGTLISFDNSLIA